MICRMRKIVYHNSNATSFRFYPIVICIFPSFSSCYFSRNQNGKASSYGLLFSHVETILVMFSKESLTGSGIICSCWLEILCKVWKNSGDISSSPISLGATVVAAMIICLFLLVSQICCFDIRRILFQFPLKLAT